MITLPFYLVCNYIFSLQLFHALKILGDLIFFEVYIYKGVLKLENQGYWKQHGRAVSKRESI